MSEKKIAARSGQEVLSAEFYFNFDDTMFDKDGAVKDFKTTGTSIVADIIPCPVGCTILSGEVVTDVAVTGSTAYNISVGDATSATRYLGATNRVAAGRTPLVPTGFISTGEPIRLTVAPTVADATAGKVTVRVQYVKTDKADVILL